MATFTDKKVVDELIANNGHFMDDPVPLMIIEYWNVAPAYLKRIEGDGNLCWSVCYVPEDIVATFQSPYVHKPKIIWTHAGGDWRKL